MPKNTRKKKTKGTLASEELIQSLKEARTEADLGNARRAAEMIDVLIQTLSPKEERGAVQE